MNTQTLPLHTRQRQPFDLLKGVKAVRRAGSAQSWTVQVGDPQCGPVAGRVCALRNTREAIRIAHKSLRQKASKKGRQLQPQTLEFAKYVIVFTTFSEAEFSAAQVLDWYRMRWQVELVFALQIARAARASAQARRRQRQGLAR
ncbi:MAG: transposase [Acidobacteriia bacterium]|nr:transposase [Terriglobia bacterium]MYK09022.1 transposase [Terriglobia bacterium]